MLRLLPGVNDSRMASPPPDNVPTILRPEGAVQHQPWQRLPCR